MVSIKNQVCVLPGCSGESNQVRDPSLVLQPLCTVKKQTFSHCPDGHKILWTSKTIHRSKHYRRAHKILADPSHILHPEYVLLPNFMLCFILFILIYCWYRYVLLVLWVRKLCNSGCVLCIVYYDLTYLFACLAHFIVCFKCDICDLVIYM